MKGFRTPNEGKHTPGREERKFLSLRKDKAFFMLFSAMRLKVSLLSRTTPRSLSESCLNPRIIKMKFMFIQ